MIREFRLPVAGLLRDKATDLNSLKPDLIMKSQNNEVNKSQNLNNCKSMNTDSLVPAYLVKVIDPTGKGRTLSNTFIDPVLLTARKQAFQHAEQLAAQKLATQALDIQVHLVELDRTVVPNRHSIIATVYNQRFHRTRIIPEGKLKQIKMALEAKDTNLPESLNLTMDVTKEDEAFNSPSAVWESLGELTCEYEYYYQGFDPGLGYIQLSIQEPFISQSEVKDLSSLSDEEIERRLAILKKPRPYSSFFMLNDALPYAASLVGSYNEHYSKEGESLSFNTKFLPQR